LACLEGLPLKALARTILISEGLSSKTLSSPAHGKVAKSELDGVEYSRRDFVDVGGLVELLERLVGSDRGSSRGGSLG